MSFADDLRKDLKKKNEENSNYNKKVIQENKLYNLDSALINEYVEKMIQKIKDDATAYASKRELWGYLGIRPRDKNPFSAVITNYISRSWDRYNYCYSHNTAKIIKDKLKKELKDLGFKQVKVRISPLNRTMIIIPELKNKTDQPEAIPCYCIHFSIRW